MKRSDPGTRFASIRRPSRTPSTKDFFHARHIGPVPSTHPHPGPRQPAHRRARKRGPGPRRLAGARQLVVLARLAAHARWRARPQVPHRRHRPARPRPVERRARGRARHHLQHPRLRRGDPPGGRAAVAAARGGRRLEPRRPRRARGQPRAAAGRGLHDLRHAAAALSAAGRPAGRFPQARPRLRERLERGAGPRVRRRLPGARRQRPRLSAGRRRAHRRPRARRAGREHRHARLPRRARHRRDDDAPAGRAARRAGTDRRPALPAGDGAVDAHAVAPRGAGGGRCRPRAAMEQQARFEQLLDAFVTYCQP